MAATPTFMLTLDYWKRQLSEPLFQDHLELIHMQIKALIDPAKPLPLSSKNVIIQKYLKAAKTILLVQNSQGKEHHIDWFRTVWQDCSLIQIGQVLELLPEALIENMTWAMKKINRDIPKCLPLPSDLFTFVDKTKIKAPTEIPKKQPALNVSSYPTVLIAVVEYWKTQWADPTMALYQEEIKQRLVNLLTPTSPTSSTSYSPTPEGQTRDKKVQEYLQAIKKPLWDQGNAKFTWQQLVWMNASDQQIEKALQVLPRGQVSRMLYVLDKLNTLPQRFFPKYLTLPQAFFDLEK